MAERERDGNGAFFAAAFFYFALNIVWFVEMGMGFCEEPISESFVIRANLCFWAL